MSAIYDSGTGFLLGNPSLVPLSSTSGQGLPTKEEFKTALESLILSPSGWRKIFSISGLETDNTADLSPENQVITALMALAYCEYIVDATNNKEPTIVVGIDTRPTSPDIADIMIRVFLSQKFNVQYIFIASAPEIMAYTKSYPDGFCYISASHNPIGHNGVKFGLADGGVLEEKEARILIDIFKDICNEPDAIEIARDVIEDCNISQLENVYKDTQKWKVLSQNVYHILTKEVITGIPFNKKNLQYDFMNDLRDAITKFPISVVADMNGSARILSGDEDILSKINIPLHSIHNYPRDIAHEIIPEPENLIYCAEEIERLHKEGCNHTILGFMPDCDGDRGNLAFFDNTENKARVLKAQEVFALSVLSELSFLEWKKEKDAKSEEISKNAVAINDPTSMRIDDIAMFFNAKVARAEVGEANVVNKARELRKEGYTVRILGEGSNGGNITHPAAVRDPINTLFAIIKLLLIRDNNYREGLFHTWCKKSNQEELYKPDFTLETIIKSLPAYQTTGVSEKRAIMHIKTTDHSTLKAKYQTNFEAAWKKEKDSFFKDFGISSWKAFSCNGTVETELKDDFSISGKGGLKIIFYGKEDTDKKAFIWMRGSGTEPVFRVMCDVKGTNEEEEHKLLDWHKALIEKSDK